MSCHTYTTDRAVEQTREKERKRELPRGKKEDILKR
jgi:hypothetical protein